MRKITFKYVEAQLYYYHDNKKMIHNLEKDMIFTRPSNNDENVGGGRSNIKSSTIENIVIKMDSNKKLYNIRESVKVVEDVLEHMSEPYTKLIHMKYFSKKNYTWAIICERLHVSRATAFRMRKIIIEEIADRMGLV